METEFTAAMAPLDPEIVRRLEDRNLLRSFCTFGALHRARLAKLLFDSLRDDDDENRSIAIEIVSNYVALLEDVAFWFFVLREWRSDESAKLFELLDRTEVRESDGHARSTSSALQIMEKWSIADLRREFGLPSDEALLRKHGLSEWGLRKHIQSLRTGLELLKESLQIRAADNAVLVGLNNKLKHGMVAFPFNGLYDLKVSVAVASRKRAPQDMLKVGYISCDREKLGEMADSTILGAEALFMILNIVYIARFDKDWELPPWPFGSVREATSSSR